MPLNIIDILNAILSLILIITYIAIGSIISLKFYKTRQRTFLFMGFAWIGLSGLWWGSIINTIIFLIDPYSIGLSRGHFYLMMSIAITITFAFYVLAITDLTFKKYKRYFRLFSFILIISFTIIVIFLLIIDPDIFNQSVYDPSEITIQAIIYFSNIFLFLSIFELLGIKFAIESIKSKSPIAKLKGKLILIAFILFPIGALLDSREGNFIFRTIDRIILIAAVFFFYIGFIMPDWLKTRMPKIDE